MRKPGERERENAGEEGYRRLTEVSPSSNRIARFLISSNDIDRHQREFANSPIVLHLENIYFRYISIRLRKRTYCPWASWEKNVNSSRALHMYIYIYLKVHWIIPVTRVCRWLFILESRMQRLLILSTLFCSRVLCFFKLRPTFAPRFPPSLVSNAWIYNKFK